MNILIVAPRFPYPLDAGDRITVFNLVKHLAKNHSVDLITFSDGEIPAEAQDTVRSRCRDLTVLNRSLLLRGAAAAGALARRRPLQSAHTRAFNARKTIARHVDRNDYEIIYAHTIRVAELIPKRSRTGRALRVIGMQIAMNLNYRRLAAVEQNSLLKWLFKYEASVLQRYECSIVEKFDKALAISSTDVAAICPEGNDKFFLSPHGVTVPPLADYASITRQPATIVLSGNMQYRPNIQAANFFCNDVLPIVKRQRPDVLVKLVGTDPSEEILNLAKQPGITATGRVDDMFEHLFGTTLAVAPLTAGAGLQNKVLEAMACGTPMVATSMANEGIGAVSEENILLSDSADEIATQVLRLLDDEKLRDSIGANARDFIVNNWSWERHFNDLERMFEVEAARAR